MADTTAPQGGVSSTQTAPATAPKVVSTEPATVQDGGKTGDLPGFNAGWSKASEKYESKLAAEKQRAEALEKELTSIRNSGLNADELRKATEEAQIKAKQVSERFDSYSNSVKDYFASRVQSLPEGYKQLMDNVNAEDFTKYVKTLEHVEKLAGGATTKPAPQGGAIVTQGGDSELLTEYLRAKEAGDHEKVRKLWSDRSKQKAILDELALRKR